MVFSASADASPFRRAAAVGTPDVVSTVQVTAKAEGGHYTFVEAATDQMGESRIDRNVKRFFVTLHRKVEPTHALEAAY